MTTNAAVLHYPNIEFYDDTWLKACLCIWDKVYRIVPSSYKPSDSDEAKLAIDCGLVENIVLNSKDLEATASDFEEFWLNAPFMPAGAEYEEDEYIRLHPEKVDVKIRPMLEAMSRKIPNDGFLRLSKEVANLYMLFLAENVSRRRDIPKLTYDKDMYAIMHYFQNDANFDELLYQRDAEEATASIVLPAVLPKGLEFTSMDRILEYRRQNIEGMTEFRQIVSDFSEKVARVEDLSFAESLTAEFSKNLLENRTSLAENLRLSLGEIPYAMLTVGLPTTLTAIGTFSIGVTDPFDFGRIGASCFIGALASIADATRSSRRDWRSTKSNFLVGLNKVTVSSAGVKFAIPRYDRLLEEFIND